MAMRLACQPLRCNSDVVTWGECPVMRQRPGAQLVTFSMYAATPSGHRWPVALNCWGRHLENTVVDGTILSTSMYRSATPHLCFRETGSCAYGAHRHHEDVACQLCTFCSHVWDHERTQIQLGQGLCRMFNKLRWWGNR